METYFYCSFEHSQTGFFHTRLENDGLVPVENGHDGLPEALGRFFSYGQFLVLWRDLSLPVSKPWQQPQVTASLFGLRELKGSFADGRSGTVNLAFYAAPEEATLLRRVALSVLGSFDEFAQMLFSWLQVGGPCGYQLDGAAFRQWVQECGEHSRLRILAPKDDPAIALLPYLQRTQPPRIERELLRLAVCTSSWKEIAATLGDRANWLVKPRCAFTEDAFEKAFTNREPVWKLEPGD